MIATQNPIEQEGTYPLPEAQLDRFMFNVKVDYPTLEEEEKILEVTTSGERRSASSFVSQVHPVPAETNWSDRCQSADHQLRCSTGPRDSPQRC